MSKTHEYHKKRVQITIDSQLLARIDAATNNRSQFLEDCARDLLTKGIGGAT